MIIFWKLCAECSVLVGAWMKPTRDKKDYQSYERVKSSAAAKATLDGIELHHMLRKGQYADAVNLAVYEQFYALSA